MISKKSAGHSHTLHSLEVRPFWYLLWLGSHPVNRHFHLIPAIWNFLGLLLVEETLGTAAQAATSKGHGDWPASLGLEDRYQWITSRWRIEMNMCIYIDCLWIFIGETDHCCRTKLLTFVRCRHLQGVKMSPPSPKWTMDCSVTKKNLLHLVCITSLFSQASN